MARDAHFGPGLFRFLSQLKKNNERDWFMRHKDVWESEVRQPALQFIEDFVSPLEQLSPHFRADAKPVGGSLFRIHRDVRFSKDKSPYKTAVGIQFRHESGKDAHAPGFYVHLEPRNVFLGIGMWHPDSGTASRIRDAILDDPARWKRILARRPFRTSFELIGDSLKRPPRGIDPGHPLVGDLMRKDFIATTSLSQKQVCSPEFIDLVSRRFRAGAAFAAFLTDALDLSW